MVQISSGERSEAKRAEILRRAAEVFRRKGFHAAGMRDIARGLGMAPGALYYYFESKDDLLYSCQMFSLKRLLASATEIAEADLAADVKLKRLIRSHLGHILGEFGGGRAHVEFHALPAPLLKRVVSKRDAYEALVRRVLEEGIGQGTLRAADVRLTTLSLLGALNWTVVWWRPEGRVDLNRVADQMAATFLEGLLR